MQFGFSGSSEKFNEHIKKEQRNFKSTKRITKRIKSKSRRGKRKSLKLNKKSIRFLGVNAAGLKSKITSFRKVINELNPAVFFIEETKYEDSGRLKIGSNYHIYELIRQDVWDV